MDNVIIVVDESQEVVSISVSEQLPTINLTTTGTSGPATYNGYTLNIPNYASSGSNVTINDVILYSCSF
jgi:hypothetical protein